MTGTKVQDCATLDYVAPADTPAGSYVAVGNIGGFINTEIAEGEMGALEPCGGKGSVWDVPKNTGYSFNAGDAVYYDPIPDVAYPVSTTTGFLLGYAIPTDGVWTSGESPAEVAGSADTTVRVYTGQGTAT